MPGTGLPRCVLISSPMLNIAEPVAFVAHGNATLNSANAAQNTDALREKSAHSGRQTCMLHTLTLLVFRHTALDFDRHRRRFQDRFVVRLQPIEVVVVLALAGQPREVDAVHLRRNDRDALVEARIAHKVVDNAVGNRIDAPRVA